MTRRTVGWIVLVVGSELIGLAAGSWFFGLASRSQGWGAAHAAFLFYGAVLGFFIAVWALLAALFARFVLGRRGRQERPPGPGSMNGDAR